MKKKFFILASASPRRKDLLEKAGYDFKIVPSSIDESEFSHEGKSSAKFAETLALAKAKDVAKNYPSELVLGADTIADFDGQVIGKAEDENHAEEIIRKLFSKPHKVITAVALVRLRDEIEIIESDTTIVCPKKMTQAQIKKHLEGCSWQGKAGAYAIQETGDDFVEKIEGSLTNVMGLPMDLLQGMFEKYC